MPVHLIQLHKQSIYSDPAVHPEHRPKRLRHRRIVVRKELEELEYEVNRAQERQDYYHPGAEPLEAVLREYGDRDPVDEHDDLEVGVEPREGIVLDGLRLIVEQGDQEVDGHEHDEAEAGKDDQDYVIEAEALNVS